MSDVTLMAPLLERVATVGPCPQPAVPVVTAAPLLQAVTMPVTLQKLLPPPPPLSALVVAVEE